MQTTLKATEDCLFKSVLCQVPAVLLQKKKTDSKRLSRKCLVETGSPSDSCTEECREKKKKKTEDSVLLFLFLKGTL